MDIATLGFKIDPNGLSQGVTGLKRLSREAGRTERATSRLEREAHKLGKVWGTVAGVLGSAAILGGLRAVIRATAEQEKAVAQLDSRLRSTGGAAGLMKRELLDMASGLQEVTTYGDETIVAAQNLLLTFTSIGRDVFPKATETVLDMSTAMGQDLKSSAIQLGKALNDPILGVTALSRVGVQFTESQKKMIKEMVEANKVADAQKVILSELETQMGGAARAARDTLGGSIDGLKNAFGDLLEGDSGSDGVRGTTKAINDLTDTLSSQETKNSFTAIVNGIVGITGALVEGVNWWVKWGGARSIAMGQGDIRGASDAAAQKRLNEIADLLENRAGARAGTGSYTERMFARFNDNPWVSDEELIAERDKIIAQLRERNRAQVIDEMVSNAMGVSLSTRKGSMARHEDVDEPKTKSAKATRELTEAEKAYKEIMEVNALIDEQVAEFRTDQVIAEGELMLAKRDGIAATAQLIKDMEFENGLLKMGNTERQIAIAQRYADANATEEQRQQISQLVIENERLRDAERDRVGAMDGVRESFQGTFRDLREGEGVVNTLTRAFDRLLDTLLDIAIQDLSNSLFGKPGTSGGGSIGGWIDKALGFLGSFRGGGSSGGAGSLGGFGNNLDGFMSLGFGGGRAYGGDMRSDRFYRVGEGNHPELARIGQHQYLIPGDQGRVEPMRGRTEMRGGDTINISVEGQVDMRSRSRIASDMSRELARGRRNS